MTQHYRLRVLLLAGRVTWLRHPSLPRIRTRSPQLERAEPIELRATATADPDLSALRKLADKFCHDAARVPFARTAARSAVTLAALVASQDRPESCSDGRTRIMREISVKGGIPATCVGSSGPHFDARTNVGTISEHCGRSSPLRRHPPRRSNG